MDKGRVEPSSRIRVAAGVVARRFDRETVVLDLQQGSYFSLDPLGGRIFDKLVGGSSPSEIANELKADYAISPTLLLQDILRLTSDLLSRGLVQLER